MTFMAFIGAAAFMARFFIAAFLFMTLQQVQQLGPLQVHPCSPQHGQEAEHEALQVFAFFIAAFFFMTFIAFIAFMARFMAAFAFMTLQQVQQLGPLQVHPCSPQHGQEAEHEALQVFAFFIAAFFFMTFIAFIGAEAFMARFMAAFFFMTFITFIGAAAFMARFMAAFFFMTLQQVQQLGPLQVHPFLPQHLQEAEHPDSQNLAIAMWNGCAEDLELR